MKITTLRIPESLYDELESEADAEGLSFSEYARRILRNRKENTQANTQANTGVTVDELAGWVENLERRVDALESAETDSVAVAPAPEPERGSHTEPAPRTEDADSVRSRAREALDSIGVKGRGEDVVETRKDAVMYGWELIRERGETTSTALRDDIWAEFEDRRTGYSASKNRADGFGMWDSCVRDVLKQLPGVDAPPERGTDWRWVGVE